LTGAAGTHERPGILVVGAVPEGPSPLPAAACMAVALAGRPGPDSADGPAVGLLELEPRAAPRAGLLASGAARTLEALATERAPGLHARARGAFCHLAPGEFEDGPPGGDAIATLARSGLLEVLVVVAGPARFRETLSRVGHGPCAVLIQAHRGAPASLLGLLAAELRRERHPLKIWMRPPGRIQARRALAGLDPGGEVSARCRRHAEALGVGRVPRPVSGAHGS
jgi:hypothetical protein